MGLRGVEFGAKEEGELVVERVGVRPKSIWDGIAEVWDTLAIPGHPSLLINALFLSASSRLRGLL